MLMPGALHLGKMPQISLSQNDPSESSDRMTSLTPVLCCIWHAKHEIPTFCRCHSESWKHPLHTLMISTNKIYQQYLHPNSLNAYQPRKKTLQTPNSMMHTSHHTYHHHPL